jgi:hypothetical protein
VPKLFAGSGSVQSLLIAAVTVMKPLVPDFTGRDSPTDLPGAMSPRPQVSEESDPEQFAGALVTRFPITVR